MASWFPDLLRATAFLSLHSHLVKFEWSSTACAFHSFFQNWVKLWVQLVLPNMWLHKVLSDVSVQLQAPISAIFFQLSSPEEESQSFDEQKKLLQGNILLWVTTNYDKQGSSMPVLFNLFCYGAPLKFFWWTHAPYLLKPMHPIHWPHPHPGLPDAWQEIWQVFV